MTKSSKSSSNDFMSTPFWSNVGERRPKFLTKDFQDTNDLKLNMEGSKSHCDVLATLMYEHDLVKRKALELAPAVFSSRESPQWTIFATSF